MHGPVAGHYTASSPPPAASFKFSTAALLAEAKVKEPLMDTWSPICILPPEVILTSGGTWAINFPKGMVFDCPSESGITLVEWR